MSMEDFLVGIDFGACNLKAAAFVDGKKFVLFSLTRKRAIQNTRRISFITEKIKKTTPSIKS